MLERTTIGFVTTIALTIALTIAISGMVLMTELGQLLNLPRSWVFAFFEHRKLLAGLTIACLAAATMLQYRRSRLRQRSFLAVAAICLAALFVANVFVPYFWLRSQQHNAQFISIAEADSRLGANDDVLVLEIAGDARAYPSRWMQLPHFAGHEVGGEEVVMSYCALSDLPQAFSTEFAGATADYRVIAQVHNNLIFTDTNSGELFQQITGQGEFTQQGPTSFPVQRMPWLSFKTLYPQGQVFFTKPTLFDRGTQWIFDNGLARHYEGEPLFPTLTMADQRLPGGEPVWGVNIGGEQLAIAPSAFYRQRAYRRTVGGRPILLVWYAEHQTLGVFFDSDATSTPSLLPDVYGQRGPETLERAPSYPGVRWMVWSHWYPATQLIH